MTAHHYHQTDDLRIRGISEVLAPADLHEELPITPIAAETVFHAREDIHRILHGQDDRLLVVTGPCSIHNPDAARAFAERLLPLRAALGDALVIVMRVYFEKPRTTVGWKGLINDPDLDGSFNINKGLHVARQMLLDINEMGLPAGTEFLDLISPQYVADLVSWGAIGARTTESQGHRELSSGLSSPIGFKNATDGGVQIAIDAIGAASHPHHFMSLSKAGRAAIFSTSGNEDCHLILRGGKRPNYDAESVREAVALIEKNKLKANLMIDFSHANSRKEYQRQIEVGHDVAHQIRAGNHHIMGAMIESHLLAGRQNVVAGQDLVFGQSITDACIAWDDNEQLLRHLADAVRERRAV